MIDFRPVSKDMRGIFDGVEFARRPLVRSYADIIATERPLARRSPILQHVGIPAIAVSLLIIIAVTWVAVPRSGVDRQDPTSTVQRSVQSAPMPRAFEAVVSQQVRMDPHARRDKHGQRRSARIRARGRLAEKAARIAPDHQARIRANDLARAYAEDAAITRRLNNRVLHAMDRDDKQPAPGKQDR